MRTHDYYVYIVTNVQRTVLYVGMTNNLSKRLDEHVSGCKSGLDKSFTGRYQAYHLVYYEYFGYVNDAIAREKQLKGFSRAKKNQLIEWYNPQWVFIYSGAGDFSFDMLIEWTDELVLGRAW
jgi:putative endonuclease